MYLRCASLTKGDSQATFVVWLVRFPTVTSAQEKSARYLNFMKIQLTLKWEKIGIFSDKEN